VALADTLARRRAELLARANRAYAVLSHIAQHGHDDGSEPCVSPEEN